MNRRDFFAFLGCSALAPFVKVKPVPAVTQGTCGECRHWTPWVSCPSGTCEVQTRVEHPDRVHTLYIYVDYPASHRCDCGEFKPTPLTAREAVMLDEAPYRRWELAVYEQRKKLRAQMQRDLDRALLEAVRT